MRSYAGISYLSYRRDNVDFPNWHHSFCIILKNKFLRAALEHHGGQFQNNYGFILFQLMLYCAMYWFPILNSSTTLYGSTLNNTL